MAEQLTPPPELLQQWSTEYWGNPGASIGNNEKYIATQAARWGADRQLEQCVAWLDGHEWDGWAAEQMRSCCRPKPPSLKEQALAALKRQSTRSIPSLKAAEDCVTIRRALELLDD